MICQHLIQDNLCFFVWMQEGWKVVTLASLYLKQFKSIYLFLGVYCPCLCKLHLCLYLLLVVFLYWWDYHIISLYLCFYSYETRTKWNVTCASVSKSIQCILFFVFASFSEISKRGGSRTGMCLPIKAIQMLHVWTFHRVTVSLRYNICFVAQEYLLKWEHTIQRYNI